MLGVFIEQSHEAFKQAFAKCQDLISSQQYKKEVIEGTQVIIYGKDKELSAYQGKSTNGNFSGEEVRPEQLIPLEDDNFKDF